MKKKIFICGISTECCSYSTLIQNKKDFEVLSGKKLLKYIENYFRARIYRSRCKTKLWHRSYGRKSEKTDQSLQKFWNWKGKNFD